MTAGRVTIVHADGTPCGHPGTATTGRCPAGIEVTHVRIGDQLVTLDQAAAAFGELAAVIVRAASAYINALARALAGIRLESGARADTGDPTGDPPVTGARYLKSQ